MTEATAIDLQYMQQALALARHGTGYVSPNPLVGCVIVKDGVVVGQGHHQRFGGPHAEVYALQEAGERARGAVLYVTLEPCCHTGKTPPCVEAVLRAGVGRVVVALRDPNPLVDGGGLARLQAAGIPCTAGVCTEAARRLNEAFIKYIITRRPFVTFKGAMTLDGKIATRTGASQWITGVLARQEGHRLRHAADAILVGLGTVLQDNPQLTTRLPEGGGVNALRVLADSTLQLPLEAQLTQVTPTCRTLVATTERADLARRTLLTQRGVEVVVLPAADDGRVSLVALLDHLGARGIASLLVEGGATLSAALLQHRLVDKLALFMAPKMIGGDGLSLLGPCGVMHMEQVIAWHGLSSRQIGEDILLEAYMYDIPTDAESSMGDKG